MFGGTCGNFSWHVGATRLFLRGICGHLQYLRSYVLIHAFKVKDLVMTVTWTKRRDKCSLRSPSEFALMWVSGPQHEEPQSPPDVDRVLMRHCDKEKNKVTNAREGFKSSAAGDCFSSFTQKPSALPLEGAGREKKPPDDRVDERASRRPPDEKSPRPGNS